MSNLVTKDLPTDAPEIRIVDALAKFLRVDAEKIHPDATLAGDLRVDSLDFLSLVLKIEDHFEIKLPDTEAARLTTVGDLMDAIRRQLS